MSQTYQEKLQEFLKTGQGIFEILPHWNAYFPILCRLSFEFFEDLEQTSRYIFLLARYPKPVDTTDFPPTIRYERIIEVIDFIEPRLKETHNTSWKYIYGEGVWASHQLRKYDKILTWYDRYKKMEFTEDNLFQEASHINNHPTLYKRIIENLSIGQKENIERKELNDEMINHLLNGKNPSMLKAAWSLDLHQRILTELKKLNSHPATESYLYAILTLPNAGKYSKEIIELVQFTLGVMNRNNLSDKDLPSLKYIFLKGICAALDFFNTDLAQKYMDIFESIKGEFNSKDSYDKYYKKLYFMLMDPKKEFIEKLNRKLERAKKGKVIQLTDEELGFLAKRKISLVIFTLNHSGEIYAINENSELVYFNGQAIVEPPCRLIYPVENLIPFVLSNTQDSSHRFIVKTLKGKHQIYCRRFGSYIIIKRQWNMEMYTGHLFLVLSFNDRETSSAVFKEIEKTLCDKNWVNIFEPDSNRVVLSVYKTPLLPFLSESKTNFMGVSDKYWVSGGWKATIEELERVREFDSKENALREIEAIETQYYLLGSTIASFIVPDN